VRLRAPLVAAPEAASSRMQFSFFEADLAAVNRSRTPWVIFAGPTTLLQATYAHVSQPHSATLDLNCRAPANVLELDERYWPR
jgi:hypothetical protein